MKRFDSIARGLVAAWLAGPWTLEGMLARTAAALELERLPPELERVVGGFWRLRPTGPASAFERSLLALEIAAHADFRLVRSTLRRPRTLLTPEVMSPSKAGWTVPELPTLAALAGWLDITPSELLWLADLRRTAQHYERRWCGQRLIEAPRPRLKRVQRSIARSLLTTIPPHPAAHGFRPRRSVLTAVTPHTSQPMLTVFDLQRFFPSVRASRVHAVFRSAGYPHEVARVLTGLCTSVAHELPAQESLGLERDRHLEAARYGARHLPQGAPTSPALANLCAFGLDCRLDSLARHVGACYTRYADDLLLSGPQSLASRGFAASVARIVAAEGFAVNPRKTRAMGRSTRQTALGLVLNDRPSLPRAERELLEAILVNCVKLGPASQDRDACPEFRNRLAGRVAWAQQVDRAHGARLCRLFDAIVW